ncbi:MAG: Shedu anti-phage system protein SduA domain-containing protein [Clostridium sp.]
MEGYEELKLILENAKGEREMAHYLKDNLKLIKYSLNTWSWNCVICKPEFKLGTKFIADYVIVNAISGCWNCVLIEMQSHKDRIFLNDGTASRGLREAQKQLQEWRMWIESHDMEMRECLADVVKGEPAQCSNAERHTKAETELRDNKTVIHFYYKVLIGRRSFLNHESNQRRNYFGNIEIVTFDRLLDYQKKIDEKWKLK